jgi:hypothetical protein
MNSLLFADPTMALTLAHYHQQDVRRAVGRKRRRWTTFATPRPTLKPAGITSVPALTEVEVPAPRHDSDSLIAS